MDKAKEHALSQYEDEVPIPYEEAPAYEVGARSKVGNAIGTTLTIDPTGMSVIELPLGSGAPRYTLSTSLLHVHASTSVDVSRPDKNTGKPFALYAIGDEFITPVHPVLPMFKKILVRRSTGVFAAMGLRKTLWDFSTQAPIPVKDNKIDAPATGGTTGGTEGTYLVALGGDEIGVQIHLLRFYDGKWVDDNEEVVALAREGGAECEGMPVLSVVKDLKQEVMDFLISAWCVTLWGDIGKRAHHHKDK
jgi:hypothetical protein